MGRAPVQVGRARGRSVSGGAAVVPHAVDQLSAALAREQLLHDEREARDLHAERGRLILSRQGPLEDVLALPEHARLLDEVGRDVVVRAERAEAVVVGPVHLLTDARELAEHIRHRPRRAVREPAERRVGREIVEPRERVSDQLELQHVLRKLHAPLLLRLGQKLVVCVAHLCTEGRKRQTSARRRTSAGRGFATLQR
eukprot:4629603-Prymnesium_polylepis.1